MGAGVRVPCTADRANQCVLAMRQQQQQQQQIIYSIFERGTTMAQSIYVKAASKADLNRRLARGERIMGTVYTIDSVDIVPLNTMPDGSAVKVWSKSYGSTPIAKAYGAWNASKRKVE